MGGAPRLLQRTTHICARLHTGFGAFFVLSAGAGAGTLPVDVAIAHPPMTNHAGVRKDMDHMESALQAGKPHYFGWTFEDPARLKPGRWDIVIRYAGVTLLDQPFDIDFTCGVPIS